MQAWAAPVVVWRTALCWKGAADERERQFSSSRTSITKLSQEDSKQTHGFNVDFSFHSDGNLTACISFINCSYL